MRHGSRVGSFPFHEGLRPRSWPASNSHGLAFAVPSRRVALIVDPCRSRGCGLWHLRRRGLRGLYALATRALVSEYRGLVLLTDRTPYRAHERLVRPRVVRARRARGRRAQPGGSLVARRRPGRSRSRDARRFRADRRSRTVGDPGSRTPRWALGVRTDRRVRCDDARRAAPL